MATPETITLKARDAQILDAVADGTVTPGDVCDYSGTESSGELQATRQGTDDAPDVLVATEYAQAGKGIDDDYADGDYIQLRRPLPGERYYARLVAGGDATAGSDANVTVGDVLAPSGTDGTLELAGTEANASFQAVEAVDNSGAASGEHARIRVEAI
jgi:hypothetical protein